MSDASVPLPVPAAVAPGDVKTSPLVAAIQAERDSLAERAKRMRDNADKLDNEVATLDAALKVLTSDSNMRSALEQLVAIAKRAKL